VKQEVMARQFHVPSHPGVQKKRLILIGIHFYFTRKKNLGVPIIVASFGEKNIYFIM